MYRSQRFVIFRSILRNEGLNHTPTFLQLLQLSLERSQFILIHPAKKGKPHWKTKTFHTQFQNNLHTEITWVVTGMSSESFRREREIKCASWFKMQEQPKGSERDKDSVFLILSQFCTLSCHPTCRNQSKHLQICGHADFNKQVTMINRQDYTKTESVRPFSSSLANVSNTHTHAHTHRKGTEHSASINSAMRL